MIGAQNLQLLHQLGDEPGFEDEIRDSLIAE